MVMTKTDSSPRNPFDTPSAGAPAFDEASGPSTLHLPVAPRVEPASARMPIGAPLLTERPPGGDTTLRHETPFALVAPLPVRSDRATLTMLAGPTAGAAFSITRTRACVLGRDEGADVRIDEGSVSRHHARIGRDAQGHFVIEDLDSTNGTFVNAQRVRRVMLSSGFRIQLGPRVVFRFAVVDEAEDELQRRLYELSTRDTLTGAFNRKYFFERLAAEVARAERRDEDLSVLMIDVDRFKSVNDTFGHGTGDRVLRAVATRAAEVVRAADVFARLGGEEFAVLARTSSLGEAIALAERVRTAVEGAPVCCGDDAVRTTVSVGVAMLSEHAAPHDVRELLASADRRLYAAKALGRNRVCAAE